MNDDQYSRISKELNINSDGNRQTSTPEIVETRLEELRRKAEKQLSARKNDPDDRSGKDPLQILHDLHVHQIELELQNEELREAQRALQQSRDRYLELFHQAPVGYLVTDSAGIILQSNLTFSQMVQRDPARLIQRPLSQLIHAEDHTRFFSHFKSFHRNPKDKRLELRLLTKDDAVLHCLLEGRRIESTTALATKHAQTDLLFITVIDITRRFKAEKSIVRAKTQWQQTFDAVPDLMAIIDGRGKIVRVNRALARRMGVTPHDCVGKKYVEIFHDGSVPPAKSPYQHFLTRGRPVATEHFSAKLKGHFITMVAPLSSDDQTAGWCVHISHDITDRKKAEKELLKSRNLESIGTLAGGIAHDFNNILTALVGSVDLAKIYRHDRTKVDAHLKRALEAAFRAKDLANRLITFAEGGNSQNQAAFIDELLKEALEMSLSGTNIDYDLQCAGRRNPIISDAAQLKTAFQNIINNAREAMPWGGKLTARIDNINLEPRPGNLLKPGQYLKIDIHDEGVGIRAAHLEKIFDPYFTTKQMGTQKGMGLGLAISHSIINKHQGQIKVRSQEGQGTTVTILLPLSPTDSISPHEVLKPDAKRETLKSRILFLEDEKIIWEVIRPQVEHLNYEADFVPNGQQAIERYEQSVREGRPYALLMLDLTIRGGMGAKEVIRNLLAFDPSVKAAVYSGYTADPIFTEFHHYGFVGALKKPFQLNELEVFLKDCIEKSGENVHVT